MNCHTCAVERSENARKYRKSYCNSQALLRTNAENDDTNRGESRRVHVASWLHADDVISKQEEELFCYFYIFFFLLRFFCSPLFWREGTNSSLKRCSHPPRNLPAVVQLLLSLVYKPKNQTDELSFRTLLALMCGAVPCSTGLDGPKGYAHCFDDETYSVAEQSPPNHSVSNQRPWQLDRN